MKRACLLIVLPALLVALGFAQTPATSSNSDPTTIKGCLSGSDGNYTFVEDNTGHNFKITTSSVDLKPHLGHDMALTGQKASATATSGAADSSFAVTSLNMISEHCAAAAAAPAASISTPADNAIAPTAAAAAPAATIATPAEPVSTPADATASAPAVTTAPEIAVTPPAAAAAPAATVPTPAETASAHDAAATPPPATVKPPAEIVEAPPADATGRTPPSARSRRPTATPAAATVAAPPAETSSTPVADAATLPATDNASAGTASTPAAAAAIPTVTPKKGSSFLWIPIVVVVLIMGALAPLLNRWRKRRLLERSEAQNLSFSHRAISEPGTSDKPVTRKAA
jgi:hypothetical protein